MFLAHDHGTKGMEQSALQRFRKIVGEHAAGGTICDRELLFVMSIFDSKKIPDVNVTRISGTGVAFVLFHFHCALVVLKNDVSAEIVALSLHKIAEVNIVGYVVTCTHNFGLV
jgi:hypothetical protein